MESVIVGKKAAQSDERCQQGAAPWEKKKQGGAA
jgi:hypothetical protein